MVETNTKLAKIAKSRGFSFAFFAAFCSVPT
jgi:hypothetical protein